MRLRGKAAAEVLDGFLNKPLWQVFGLPGGEDMDGQGLEEVFEQPRPIAVIPSRDEVPGECGMHAADFVMDPEYRSDLKSCEKRG